MLLITNGICHRPVHTLCNRLQSGGIVDVDPLLISRLKSGVFANGAHGFGHIFMYLMGGNTGTYIKLSLDPLAVANICMLSMFWIGTLRSKPKNYPRHTNVRRSTYHPIHARCSSKPSIYIQSSGYFVSW